ANTATDARPPKRPISSGQRPRSAGVRPTAVVGLLAAGLRPALGRLLGHGREATRSRISSRWDRMTAPDNFHAAQRATAPETPWSRPLGAPGRTRTHDPLLRSKPGPCAVLTRKNARQAPTERRQLSAAPRGRGGHHPPPALGPRLFGGGVDRALRASPATRATARQESRPAVPSPVPEPIASEPTG